MDLVRSRLLHYLLLGGAMLLARDGLAEPWSRLPWGDRPTLVVTAADRSRARAELGSAWRPDREQQLLDRQIDDELLYRAAIARSLDQDNAVVRDRVVQDMRLVSADEQSDDETMFREGLRLGLDRSDVVVRRHLAETMRLLAAAPARLEAATDEDLRDFVARRAQEFRSPAATSLTQVFLSFARGRAEAETAARRLLEELRSAESYAARPAAPLPGDGFPLGVVLKDRSDADIDGIFGRGFAAAVARLPEQRWEGPIESSYGFHLVHVDARRAAGEPSLEASRRRATEQLYRERSQQRLATWLAAERERYEIRIEDSPSADPSVEQASLSVGALALPRTAIVGD